MGWCWVPTLKYGWIMLVPLIMASDILDLPQYNPSSQGKENGFRQLRKSDVPAASANEDLSTFQDRDCAAGSIEGILTIFRATLESDIDTYSIYWGSDEVTMVSTQALVEIPVTFTGATQLEVIPTTSVPAGALYLLIFSENSAGLRHPPAAVPINDIQNPVLDVQPVTVVFEDTDGNKGEIGGTVLIEVVELHLELPIDRYNVYLSADQTSLSVYVGTVSSSATMVRDRYLPVAVPLNTFVNETTYLIVQPTYLNCATTTGFTTLLVEDLNNVGPLYGAASFTYADDECDIDTFHGYVNITRQDYDVGVDEFRVYFGSSSTSKSDPAHVAVLPVGELSGIASGAIPTGSTHIIVTPWNLVPGQADREGEIDTWISLPLVELRPSTNLVTGLVWQDSDPNEGVLEGSLSFSVIDTRSDTFITSYDVYFSSEAGRVMYAGTVSQDNSATVLSVLLPSGTPFPGNATSDRMAVYSANRYCLSASAPTIPIDDVAEDHARSVDFLRVTELSSSSLRLSWNQPLFGTRYKVQIRNSSIPTVEEIREDELVWSDLVTDLTQTTYEVLNLASGRNYVLRVVAGTQFILQKDYLGTLLLAQTTDTVPTLPSVAAILSVSSTLLEFRLYNPSGSRHRIELRQIGCDLTDVSCTYETLQDDFSDDKFAVSTLPGVGTPTSDFTYYLRFVSGNDHGYQSRIFSRLLPVVFTDSSPGSVTTTVRRLHVERDMATVTFNQPSSTNFSVEVLVGSTWMSVAENVTSGRHDLTYVPVSTDPLVDLERVRSGQLYNLRVFGWNSNGEQDSAGFGYIQVKTTDLVPPSEEAVTDLNIAFLDSTTVQLVWEADSTAATTQFQVFLVHGGTETMLSQGLHEYEIFIEPSVFTLESGALYTARVVAGNNHGYLSGAHEEISFYVSSDTPRFQVLNPILLAVSGNAVTIGFDPVLDASHYQVAIDDGTTGYRAFTDLALATDTPVFTIDSFPDLKKATLVANHEYKVRVRAGNFNGLQDISLVLYFSVFPTDNPPANGQLVDTFTRLHLSPTHATLHFFHQAATAYTLQRLTVDGKLLNEVANTTSTVVDVSLVGKHCFPCTFFVSAGNAAVNPPELEFQTTPRAMSVYAASVAPPIIFDLWRSDLQLSSVTLEWSDLSNATYYIVQKVVAGGAIVNVTVVPHYEPQYIVGADSLDVGENTFRVLSVNDFGVSSQPTRPMIVEPIGTAPVTSAALDAVLVTSEENDGYAILVFPLASATFFQIEYATDDNLVFAVYDDGTTTDFGSYANDTYTAIGLELDVVHYFRITAGNTHGLQDSSLSVTVTVDTPRYEPGPISNLVVTHVNETSVSFSWTPGVYSNRTLVRVRGPWVYYDYMVIDSHFDRSTITVSGLTTNREHQFEFLGGNGFRTEAEGVSVFVTPTTKPNQLISGLWVNSLQATSISVYWDALGTASYYRVEFKLASDASFTLLDESVSESSCSIPGLVSGTIYDVRITPGNSNGLGLPSTIQAQTTANAPLTAISDAVIVYANSTAAVIAWQHLLDANQYIVSDGTTTQLVFGTNATFGGLTSNVDVTFTVTAGNNNGFEPTGYDITLKTRFLPPAPLNLKVSSLSATAVELSWDPVADADRYLLEVSADGREFVPVLAEDDGRSPWWPAAVEWTVSTGFDHPLRVSYSLTLTGAAASYQFRVTAANFAGFEPNRAYLWQGITLTSSAPDSDVTNLRATKSSPTGIRLEWSPVRTAYKYSIQQRTLRGDWVVVESDFQNTDPRIGSSDDWSLDTFAFYDVTTIEEKYEFRISAGNDGGFTEGRDVRFKPTGSAPGRMPNSLVVVSSTPNSITVAWYTVPSAFKYRVDVRYAEEDSSSVEFVEDAVVYNTEQRGIWQLDTSEFSRVNIGDEGLEHFTATYTVEHLVQDSFFTIRVTPGNSAGWSQHAVEYSGYTVNTPTSSVTNLRVIGNSHDRVRLAWDSPFNALWYKVQWKLENQDDSTYTEPIVIGFNSIFDKTEHDVLLDTSAQVRVRVFAGNTLGFETEGEVVVGQAAVLATPSSLVFSYDFDSLESGFVADRSTSSNHGTLVTGGIASGYLQPSSIVQTTASAVFPASISLWMNTPTLASMDIVGARLGCSSQVSLLKVSATGALSVAGQTTSFSVSADTWYHVAILLTQTGVVVFVDSSQEWSSSTPISTAALVDVTVGGSCETDGYSTPFLGLLDHVAVFSKLLTAQDIQSLAGQAQFWRFMTQGPSAGEATAGQNGYEWRVSDIAVYANTDFLGVAVDLSGFPDLSNCHDMEAPPSYAFDAFPSTSWQACMNQANQYIGFDAGATIAIHSVDLSVPTAEYVPSAIVVQLSHDLENWETVGRFYNTTVLPAVLGVSPAELTSAVYRTCPRVSLPFADFTAQDAVLYQHRRGGMSILKDSLVDGLVSTSWAAMPNTTHRISLRWFAEEPMDVTISLEGVAESFTKTVSLTNAILESSIDVEFSTTPVSVSLAPAVGSSAIGDEFTVISLQVQNHCDDCSRQTIQGPKNGTSCIFPFTYNNIEYTDCAPPTVTPPTSSSNFEWTSLVRGPWCATSVDGLQAVQTDAWGYCGVCGLTGGLAAGFCENCVAQPQRVEVVYVSSIAADTVTLRWTNVDDAFRYLVEYRKVENRVLASGETRPDFAHPEVRYLACEEMPCELFWEVSGLEAGELYQFRVWSGNQVYAKEGATSVIQTSARRPQGPVGDLQIMRVSADSITLGWSPEFSSFRYRIEYSGVFDSLVFSDATPSIDIFESELQGFLTCEDVPCFLEYTVGGGPELYLTTESVYSMRVTPINNFGSGGEVTIGGAPTSQLPSDAVTEIVVNSVTSSTLTLQWEPVETAFYYLIYVNGVLEHEYFICYDGPDPTNLQALLPCRIQYKREFVTTDINIEILDSTVTGLATGGDFEITIVAANNFGISPVNSSFTQVTEDPPTNPPTELEVTSVGQTSVTLDWTEAVDASRYKLEIKEAEFDNAGYMVITTSIEGPPHLVGGDSLFRFGDGTRAGLKTNVEYDFRVCSGNAAGFEITCAEVRDTPRSVISSISAPALKSSPSLNKITKARAKQATGSVILEWEVDTSQDIRFWAIDVRFEETTGYNISESIFVNNIAVNGQQTYTVTGLETFNAYVFRIRAGNLAGYADDGIEIYWYLSDTPYVEEFEVLAALYDSLGGPFWNFNTGWDTVTAASKCTIFGIMCSNGLVLELNLGANNLTGTIPRQVGQLEALASLVLSQNHISGTFPYEISQLSALTRIDFHKNDLSAEIPRTVGVLTTMIRLDMSDNFFTSEIPSTIYKLTRLRHLSLSSNNLNGTISDSIGQLSDLQSLDLSMNKLTGVIPDRLFTSPLHRLALSYNSLSGSIPQLVERLVFLEHLHLDHNMLSGQLPAEVRTCIRLQTLDLQSNSLDGSVPSDLSEMTRLREILFNENGLIGSIPPELGRLSNLHVLRLDQNQMEGSLPEWDGNDFPVLNTLILSENKLSSTIPSQFGTLTSLARLVVNDNMLSGPIPSQLGSLGTNLRVLNMHNNMLSSTLAAELGGMQALTELRISNNSLSGSIPPELAGLTNLEHFMIDTNFFVGEFDPMISRGMRNIRFFSCFDNLLYGSTPSNLRHACNCTVCLPRSMLCGDGIATYALEMCDDGDTVSGDGCSSTCQVESGWHCSQDFYGTSTCVEMCGDGVRTVSEECDDANNLHGDGCSASCVIESGWSCAEDRDLFSHCSTICGDSLLRDQEQCDDGNSFPSDGCSARCQIEFGWQCTTVSPEEQSSCFQVCGNGLVTASEQCDDGNVVNGDGCNSYCLIEVGWECQNTDSPSSCAEVCGNLLVSANEECDDGNNIPGDGCSPNCRIETGWHNTTFTNGTLWNGDEVVFLNIFEVCGDGVVTPSEMCDDGNLDVADGCTSCQIDEGWMCTESELFYSDLFLYELEDLRSGCRQICGNGVRTWTGYPATPGYNYTLWDNIFTFDNLDEECDDGNDEFNDGCEFCRIQYGWACMEVNGSRISTCYETCQNGILTRSEQCDDGNSVPGLVDGCTVDCSIQIGWNCSVPGPLNWTSDDPNRGFSTCVEVCGEYNGIRTQFEECDDGNNNDGDGCSSVCIVETGWVCDGGVGEGSSCFDICGDGVARTPATCDDQNLVDGDGCSSTCEVEPGFTCTQNDAQLSQCESICGDGLVVGEEECDDGNTAGGDGCDITCRIESSFRCGGVPSQCCQVQYGADYSGRLLAWAQNDTFTAGYCCEWCSRDPFCNVWVFWHRETFIDQDDHVVPDPRFGQCWLKRDNSPPRLNRNHAVDYPYDALVSGLHPTGNIAVPGVWPEGVTQGLDFTLPQCTFEGSSPPESEDFHCNQPFPVEGHVV